MKASQINRSGRTAAVVLFFLLVGGLLIVTFGAGYSLFKQERDQAASVLRGTGQVRAVIDRQQAAADRLAAIDQQQLLDMVYLRAPNAAVAVATLQDKITGLAAATGTRMRRISVIDGSGNTGRVSVRAQVTGDLDQISSFLVEVERSHPLLTFEQISISRARARRRLGAGSPQQKQQFASLMTLSAAIRTGGADER